MRNDLHVQDIGLHLHPQTNPRAHETRGPLIMAQGNGARVVDSDGREYIEGMASLWCASLGFNDARLAAAAAAQFATLSTYHTFNHRSNQPCIELSEALLAIAPIAPARVTYTNSGSEANDTMIKLAWLYQAGRGKPHKRKIICRRGAYHGSTIFGSALSGLDHVRGPLVPPASEILFTDTPHYYRRTQSEQSPAAFVDQLIGNLEALIVAEGADTIAAMIVEPVTGAGGVIMPPDGYFPRLAELLRRHDILLLSDEVICGFGRTGHWFGSQAFGFTPDMMSVAKGLSSGYQPIGAVVLSEAIFAAAADEADRIGTFGHGFTYAGHPVTSAVARETLKIYQEMDLIGHVRRRAVPFQRQLQAFADHPLVGDVRGIGLLGALELVADRDARTPFAPGLRVGPRVVESALAHGLIVRSLGDIIAVCPPLIIEEADITELFARLMRALDDVAASLAADKLSSKEVH